MTLLVPLGDSASLTLSESYSRLCLTLAYTLSRSPSRTLAHPLSHSPSRILVYPPSLSPPPPPASRTLAYSLFIAS